MSEAHRTALAALDQAVAALTYDHIEVAGPSGEWTAVTDQPPLLSRSIGQDLTRIEAVIGGGAKGKTQLSGIAQSIDQALVEIETARAVLRAAGAGA